LNKKHFVKLLLQRLHLFSVAGVDIIEGLTSNLGEISWEQVLLLAVGQGSADKKNKGSEHMTLGVDHLIGPRVVDAGSVALASGTPSTATVAFAGTLASASGYYIQATPVGATSGIATAGVAVSTVVNTTGFVLTGGNNVTTTINWVLFKL
jgi:hypothetical protein